MIYNENNLIIFSSDVSHGNMSAKYDNEETVRENKKNFFETISICESKTYNLDILYSDIILNIKETPKSHFLKCDAIITQLQDIYVYLAFGDCIPFVVYDEQKSTVAFAHLGWQSICKNLHTKVIKSMIEYYGAVPSMLKVFFGPSITKESYAFENPAQLKMPEWVEHISYENGLYHIDLIGYIINQIKQLGINLENINSSNINTATNKSYYSHYRSMHTLEKEGRFLYGTGLTTLRDKG